MPLQALTFLLAALVWLPSLRPLFKFAHHFGAEPWLLAPITAALTYAGVALVLSPPRGLKHLLATPWPWAGVVVSISVAVAGLYPLADGLRHSGAGSDADDAMVMGGVALWHLANPYALTTYLGNPFSPGPGWMALASPLAAGGIYPLITPLALAAMAGLLRVARHSWLTISQVSLLVAACPLVWELAVVGNDLPALSLLLVGVVALAAQPRLGSGWLAALIALIVALATARIAFAYLPLLIGFSVLAVWPQRALQIGLYGLIGTLGLHGLFWALNPEAYAPLHLLTRAEGLLSGAARFGAIGILAVVGATMLYKWRWWAPANHVALGLGAPMGVLALAELSLHGTLARWEGATFLIPALAISLFAVLHLKRHPHATKKSS